jgi:RimJ/RimL family protein N-acetyltransferase
MTGYASVGWSAAPPETARLLLRPLLPRDLDELRAAGSGDDLRCWSTCGGDASWLRAAITERATGRLLGAAELCLDRAGRRRRGWRSGSPAGPGATGMAATWALSAWAFQHGASRVELLARPENVAAQRMALAAGYRREGHLRGALSAGPIRADAVVFARLATDSALPGRRLLPDVGELSDGVVTVRPVRHGDEQALLDERLDPESRRWATTTRLWTAPDVSAFVAGSAAVWLAGTEARFAIVETAVRAGFRLEGIALLRLPTSDGGRTDEARFSLLPPG